MKRDDERDGDAAHPVERRPIADPSHEQMLRLYGRSFNWPNG
jgi:hypothetical protein